MAEIVARIFGGIGNQLFIYSAARSLALRTGAELILDNVSGFAKDHAYKRNFQLNHFHIASRMATADERLEPFSRIRRYVKRTWNGCMPYERRSYLVQTENDFDARLLHVKPRGRLYLEGYWQSEKYFKDVESIIRQELEIKPPMDPVNQLLAGRIRSSNAVGVHVRFFDKPEAGGNNGVPPEYYNNAIVAMEKISPNSHYFLFSDRPEAALRIAALPSNRVTLVSHNLGDDSAYADLWLMSQCRNYIIANSTFSWWGAWLSKSANKQVIAPKCKIGGTKNITSWGFEGLLPAGWILK